MADETRPRAMYYDPEAARHGALAQVALALTDGEAVEITHAAVDRGFPRERLPVPVSEVLDWLVEEDVFLWKTEPFFTDHDRDFGGPYDPYGAAYSATALAALGRELTVDAVRAVITRNFEPLPYDPVPDLAGLVCWARRDPNGRHPSFHAALTGLAAHGVNGSPGEIAARLRALLGRGE